MEISRAQMRALEIIQNKPVDKVGDFIHRMWPDRIGPREKISGGYVLSAMCLLRRMERADLVIWVAGRYQLSNRGRLAFFEEQQRRLTAGINPRGEE